MDKPDKKRTLQQNKALHKLFQIICDELNDAGLDVMTTLHQEMEIPWTPTMIKELLWRPTMRAMLGKESTTEMTTKDLDTIFEPIARYLAKKGIETHFPSIEEIMLANLTKTK